ncbi:MAG TPA: SNF2-related protein [Chloroflexota bacterium]|nr:SNF2-related protein [Chloroflexota bacterium]
MNASDSWFTERADLPTPPRWLGLIPRQPRLIEGTARQAMPAMPVAMQARHIRSAQPRLDTPRAVRRVGLREEERHRGSVYVAGVSLHDALATTEDASWQHDGEWDGAAGGSAGAQAPEATDEPPFARLLAAVLQPPTELLLAHEGPIEWPRPLLPYQLDGIRALIERPALLLADDMGLGKTIQSIAALRILIRQRLIESALIVVPASLISQWRSELGLWAPELRLSTVQGEPRDRAWRWRTPAHVYLTSYETLRSDFTGNPHSPVARLWDLVILDEAQRIKNADTEISRLCKRLRRRRQWALTGTPLENSIDDLVSILQFVDPGPPRASWHLVSQSELKEQLSRVQLRRRKADVLQDLPPKLVSSVILPLTPAQRAGYERAEQEGIVELRALGERVRIQNVLDLIARLKQICNFDPVSGKSSKLDDLRERLRTLDEEGHKALVFTQFSNRESGARAIADRLGMPALVYTGDLSPAERDRVLARFRAGDEHRVLVLSLRAGGQGLNLQDASYVFHFDRWWNPAVEQQAEARSHRMGQRYPVMVYTYIAENTIEERIEQVLREKQQLFDEVVDDVTIDLSSRLSSDDLFGLFGLRDPLFEARPATRPAPDVDYAAMEPAAFEAYVGRLLERAGWTVTTTPVTHDGGIDLIATRLDDVGAESTLYIQCKNQVAPLGVAVARQLNGAMLHMPGARGVLACPAGATREALAFARDRGILIWDAERLRQLEQAR